MVAYPNRSAYTHIVIHPLNEDGANEVWASYTETHPNMGTFETDGIIGWLYPISDHWVWMNEAGHPTRIFSTCPEAITWLYSLCPSVESLNNQ
jgi:hypothetical protein